jgi:hypothetical protein
MTVITNARYTGNAMVEKVAATLSREKGWSPEL